MTDLAALAQHLKRARRKMPPHPRNIAANLVQMIGELDGHVQPEWVSHERHSLPGIIKDQIERFERAMNPETAA